MKDMSAKLKRADAWNCELIGKLATAPNKRGPLKKLPVDLRAMARDTQSVIAGRAT